MAVYHMPLCAHYPLNQGTLHKDFKIYVLSLYFELIFVIALCNSELTRWLYGYFQSWGGSNTFVIVNVFLFHLPDGDHISGRNMLGILCN